MTTGEMVRSYVDATKRRKRSSFKSIRSKEDCARVKCYMYVNRRPHCWDFDLCYQFCIGEDKPAIAK